MSPLHRLLPGLAVLAGILAAQSPEPVCGLPHIWGQPAGEVVTLAKSSRVMGDRRFKIRKHYSGSTLIEVDFYLVHEDTTFAVYAEVAEVAAGHIDTAAAALAPLISAFRDETFAGSLYPDLGIKDVAEKVFGPPPDIDANGKIFILLIDVRDDYDPHTSESYIAGYFDPLDQTSRGNLADIIYLDSDPGSLAGSESLVLFATLAHEYQHLIHYRWDVDEDLWINEGLSELAPVLMGLPHRNFSRYLTDTNSALDDFSGALADYARCGLFFLYTWVQLGTSFVQDLIAFPENGVQGFNRTLEAHQGGTLDTFVRKWHLANYLQAGGEYGYGGLLTLPRPEMHQVVVQYPLRMNGGKVARLGARWTLLTAGRHLYLHVDRSGREPDITLLQGANGAIIPAPHLFTAGFDDESFGRDYQELLVLATASSNVEDSTHYDLYASAYGATQAQRTIPPASGYFYPNPFLAGLGNPGVTRLQASPEQPVEVRIYNLLGREMARLSRKADDNAPLAWNGRLSSGGLAPSGVYLAQVSVGAQVFRRKLVLLR